MLMSHTIADLWNGNIDPVASCGAHDPYVNELVGLMERHRESLSRGLTETQMETFQKYLDCSDEYLLHMLELAFCDGFSLGGRIAVEMLVR